MKHKFSFRGFLGIVVPPIGYEIFMNFIGALVFAVYFFSPLLPGGGIMNLVHDSYQLNFMATAVAAILGIPIFYHMYSKDKRLYPDGDVRPKINPVLYVLPFLAGICLASGVNQIIAISGIDQITGSYEEASDVLYSVSVFIEFLFLGIIVPITEELIFRGVVYGRLKRYFPTAVSVILCALMFGVYHGNLSQGIYAFLLGIGMCCVREKYHSLAASMLFHMGANIFSVLATETGIFDFTYATWAMFLSTLVLAFAFCIVIWWQMDERVPANKENACS